MSTEDPSRPRAPLPRLPKSAAPAAPPAEPDVKVTFKAPDRNDRNDATQIMSPPPAPAQAAAPPAPMPMPKRRTEAAEPLPKRASGNNEPIELVKRTSDRIPAEPVAKPEPKAEAAKPAPTATPARIGASGSDRSEARTEAKPEAKADAKAEGDAIPVAQSPTGTGTGRTPIPPAPVPRWSGRGRPKPDSITEAFDLATNQHHDEPFAAAPAGVSTKEDLAAVRGVFNEVAAVHVAQVRDVMLELRYGDAEPAWIESTKPALKSLRAMAAQMDLADLCDALDAFCAAVEEAIAKRMNDAGKAELLQRYQRLVELIPQAFELDGERDRREPLIIEALLYQIEGVERPIIDKLFGVGLNRLEALMRANVDEIVVVAGIRSEVATAIVDQLSSYRKTGQSVLAAADPGSERRQLHDLLIMMSLQNDEFNRVANEWSDDARATKRNLRKQREQTYQRIKVTLARLGERDQLARLERMSFDERIASLDRYLTAATAARPHA